MYLLSSLKGSNTAAHQQVSWARSLSFVGISLIFQRTGAFWWAICIDAVF